MHRHRLRSRLSSLLRACAASAFAGALLLGGAPALAESAALVGVVNLNTATAEQLELLPGIGAARARAVIEAREARGGFDSVDDLLAVKGIGEASLAKLRPHLAVDGETTVRPAQE